MAYDEKGDLDRALADYDQALKLHANFPEAYVNRGVAYHRKGDYGRAIADFTQALALNPNLAPAYYNRGTSYQRQGEPSRAITDYSQALTLNPRYIAAYVDRGSAYMDQGDYARAIADFTQALALNPNYAQPIITALWLNFLRRTTRRPGRISNVTNRLVASLIPNSSEISARRQAGKSDTVWYRGVHHAMALEQTPDSARRLEHLLLMREIEEFLYTEAALLDERRFEEWLALLTDDIRYWMPMRRNVKFGEQERENTRERQDMNWFDEGKTTLQQRVQQIMTGVHWAEEPCHVCVTWSPTCRSCKLPLRRSPCRAVFWCTATGCRMRPIFLSASARTFTEG